MILLAGRGIQGQWMLLKKSSGLSREILHSNVKPTTHRRISAMDLTKLAAKLWFGIMWCCGIYGCCNVFWASMDTEKTVESSTTNIKDTLNPAMLCSGCLDGGPFVQMMSLFSLSFMIQTMKPIQNRMNVREGSSSHCNQVMSCIRHWSCCY